MTDTNKPDDPVKALFVNLVLMLSTSAMQQLGKIVNPLTNKTEMNLNAAQMTIDMLDMIRAKTKGNLDKDEDRLLSDVISSLQLNYVESSSGAPPKNEEKPREPAPEQPGNRPKQDESRERKFHKSYG